MEMQALRSKPLSQSDRELFQNAVCPYIFQRKTPFQQSKFPKQLKSSSREIVICLLQRIIQLQKKMDELERISAQNPRKKKKIRRKAKQISRSYKCSYPTCQKFYGSKTSLKNHMKLKHGYRMRRYIIQSRQNYSEQ